MQLDPMIEIKIHLRDGTPVTVTATHYEMPDEDHTRPWIESWSVEDEDGDEIECRTDEDGDNGRELDEQLQTRVCARCYHPATGDEVHGVMRADAEADLIAHDGGCDRCCCCAGRS